MVGVGVGVAVGSAIVGRGWTLNLVARVQNLHGAALLSLPLSALRLGNQRPWHV